MTGRSKERPELAEPCPPAGGPPARRALPRRRGGCCAGCSSRSATRSTAEPIAARRRRSRVGRQPLPRRRARRHRRAQEPARAPVRAAAGARRRQALLGRRRRGREAAAPGRSAGWPAHPERELIARRYLRHDRRLTGDALARLIDDDDSATTPTRPPRRTTPRRRRSSDRISLNDQRSPRWSARSRPRGARTVVDLGCGAGTLLRASCSANRRSSTSSASTCRAGRSRPRRARLHLDTMAPRQRERVDLCPGRAHLPGPAPRGLRRGGGGRGDRAPRSRRGSRASSGRCSATPARRLVVVTTPNVEYNVALRGPARRRACATATTASSGPAPSSPPWAAGVAERHGYAVESRRIGPVDADVGAADPDGGVPSMSTEIKHPRSVPGRCSSGVSGSGKSTFAARHFAPTEVLSSDFCRGLVADDENDQAATDAAFEVLHYIAGKRLEAGRLAVVDATNVQPEARTPARRRSPSDITCFAIAIVLDVPPRGVPERNAARPDRDFGPHVSATSATQLRRSLQGPPPGGVPPRLRAARRRRDRRGHGRARALCGPTSATRPGPFDIIGDVHGCYDELVALLRTARLRGRTPTDRRRSHPDGRTRCSSATSSTAARQSPRCCAWRWAWSRPARALCIPGNHEIKLLRGSRGPQRHDQPRARRVARAARAEPPEFRTRGRHVHRRAREPLRARRRHARRRARRPAREMHGRASGAVRSFALYGDTTGETDEFGLPVRYPWAEDYRGRAAVVYGHTPVPEPTGSTARSASTPAACSAAGSPRCASPNASWCRCPRPRPTTSRRSRSPPSRCRATAGAGELDLDDVIGKRIIDDPAHRHRHDPRGERDRRARGHEPVRGRPAVARLSAAHDVADRHQQAARRARAPRRGVRGVPPRRRATRSCARRSTWARGRSWSCAATRRSRRRRFGVDDTDTAPARSTPVPVGRSSTTPTLEAALLDRVRGAIAASGLWDELATDWLVLDCELLPVVGEGRGAAAHAVRVGRRGRHRHAARRGRGALGRGRARRATRRPGARARDGAARPWPSVSSTPTGATAGPSRARRRRARALPGARRRGRRPRAHAAPVAPERDAGVWPTPIPRVFRATASIEVDLADPASEAAAVAWWEDLTAGGGEGMVVKPVDVIARDGRAASPSPASSAGAASTCASSTAPSTRRRTSSSVCASAVSGTSGRSQSASSASASKPSSGSSPASRCIGCTSACSGCSPSRASPSTRVSDRQLASCFAT